MLPTALHRICSPCPVWSSAVMFCRLGGCGCGRRQLETRSRGSVLHPPVEAAPVGEVEVRQTRLPLCAKEGGGDRIGLAVVLRHGSGPLFAVLDLEAVLVPRCEVAVAHEVIAGKEIGRAHV